MHITELIEKYTESFSVPPSLSSDRARLLWEAIAIVHEIPDHKDAEKNLLVFSHDEEQFGRLEAVIQWLFQAQQLHTRNIKIDKAISILASFYKEASELYSA